jgi:hypothetical protein
MAGTIGLELFAAADQNWNTVGLKSRDQRSGRSRNHRRAVAGGSTDSRRITVPTGAGIYLESISHLQIDTGVGPRLGG